MRKSLFASVSVALVAVVTLLLINYFHIAVPVNVTTTSRSSELSVIGEGRVDVVPDTAYVDVGITVNNAPTVDDAQKQINDVNNKLVDGLKNLGIKKEDIKTSNYSVNPNYSYENNNNKISGYNGNASLSVKLTDTKLAPQVMDVATKAGANQIGGTRFVVDDPAKYREQAREKAIDNAKQQAQQLASRLGIRLGKIENIVESSPDVPVPLYETAKMALGAGGAAAPDLQAGSQTITSVVTLYFEKN